MLSEQQFNDSKDLIFYELKEACAYNEMIAAEVNGKSSMFHFLS